MGGRRCNVRIWAGCRSLAALLLASGALASCESSDAADELLGLEAPPRGCQGRNDCTVEGRFAEPGCLAVTDGFGVCVDEVAVATAPSLPMYDECDGSRPCESGECYAVAVWIDFCGPGGGGGVTNYCLSDECDSDDDCDTGWCAPRGVGTDGVRRGGYIRRCFPASCHADADCNARAGGVCAFIEGHCMSREDPGFDYYESPTLTCVYPGGCIAASDCPPPYVCRIVDGESRCIARD
jgi:hypothetical protein